MVRWWWWWWWTSGGGGGPVVVVVEVEVEVGVFFRVVVSIVVVGD